MRETEITIQIFEDLDYILEHIKKLGFEMVCEYKLNDFYFSALDTSKKLDYSTIIKNSFLVRQLLVRDEVSNMLVYKNKEIDETGAVVSEEKIRVQLSSLENTLKIFEKANINRWCELHQNMFEFKKGNIFFTVQNIDSLGNFIEYEEDETMKDMTNTEKREFMHSQIAKLNLKMSDNISCKKVYMKYLQNLNNNKTI